MNGVEMVGPTTTKLHSKPTFALSNDWGGRQRDGRSIVEDDTYKICVVCCSSSMAYGISEEEE